jgi:hypothetical protein
MKVQIKGINLTQSQKLLYQAAHNDDLKYILAAFSRQQGKSTVVMLLCLEWLLNKSEDIIYFTPTYLLSKNIYSKIIKLLPEKLIVKSNSQELIIETITGSTLKFFSGEAAQSARGSNCTRLIVDEAAYVKDTIDGQSFWYNIVLPLIKVRGKKVIMISTPFATNGFFYELCMKAIKGEEGYLFLKRTIYDDALITPNEIEELKKGYPELAWRTEFMCEFMTNALSVFPDYEKCFKDFSFDYSNIYCGIDLSTVGEDNTILTFINNNNQTLQYNIKGELDSKYKQIADILNQYKPKGTYIEVNSIGEVMYNEIRKLLNNKDTFHKFTATNDSKKEYVNKLSVMIMNDDISFHQDNKLLYSELGTFTYKLTKNGNITYAAIPSAHDDTITSLGMAIQAKEDFKYTNNITFARRNIAKQLI